MIKLQYTFCEKMNREHYYDCLIPISRTEDKPDELLSVPMHWHPELEVIVCEAAGEFRVEDRTYQYKPGDILFALPNSFHGYVGKQAGSYYGALIDLEKVDPKSFDQSDSELRQLFNNEHDIPVLINDKDPDYATFVSIVRELSEADGSYMPKLRKKGLIFLLLSSLMSRGKPGQAFRRPPYLQSVIDAIGYMEDHYDEKIATDDISTFVQLSKYHFIHNFKKYTSMSPIDYLIVMRLTNAYYFLRHSYSVTETSALCGFNSLSYFILKFKELYGYTPHKVTKFDD